METIAAILLIAGLGLVARIFGRANQQKLEAKRQRDEAIRIVRETAPELAALRNAIAVLRDFVARANPYRPKFTLPSDTKFREVGFSNIFFPRDCEGSGDGPDPEPWVTTVDNLLVPKGHELRSIYTKCLELPLSDIKIDTDRTFLRKLFTLKLSRAWKLQEAANQLQNELAEQRRKAEEVRAPIRSVYEEYATHTGNGIERHFQLALRILALPLPSNFPWSTFYDPNESLLQVNQRVPSIVDIVVTRLDSKRPPSKKDTDYFQRRLVPAVSLHIAQHVALNDLYDDVDTIAVNCWCRYFECTTGHLKRAFVSSLKVQKKDILQINIDKADALDAFRALRGAYVYSTQEIVPIEPQVRLDKKDDRFVEGKEVLEGMAQGQNLATMDWQDFEHLIRELLAKEFGRKEGSEVRITRASRDRGVDAVIFDPDPLHGGKSVVQAKRYNNL
jgi:Restriction endonuclease